MHIHPAQLPALVESMLEDARRRAATARRSRRPPRKGRGRADAGGDRVIDLRDQAGPSRAHGHLVAKAKATARR